MASIHGFQVFTAVRSFKGWITNQELKEKFEGVSLRTIRHYTRTYTDLGVFEEMKTFGGYHYRWKGQSNNEHVKQLEATAAVFEEKPQ